MVVPHPNLAPGYPDDITDAAARRYFHLGAEHTVFAFLGAMRGYKGVDALLAAFAELCPTRPEARLILAGRQAASVEARYLVPSSRMLVPRHVEDATVQYVLRAADFVVLPYRRILTSGAAALALGFGRPLICNPDLPPLLEVVRPGQEAIVYRADQEDGLRHALDQVYAMSPADRARHAPTPVGAGRSVDLRQ